VTVASTNGVRAELGPDQRRLRLILDGPRGHIITDRLVWTMREALTRVAGERRIRLVTLEAEPPDFSFGSSIEEHLPDRIGAVLPRFHDLVRAWLDVPAVTIALVHGRCLGGGFELALCCDLIFATPAAQFGLPEIALGVFPPAAAVLLPARLGTARATSAIVAGDPRPATQWTEAGLVETLVGDGDLERAVSAWDAQHLAPRSAAAVRQAALAAREGLRHAVERLLPASERRYLEEVMRTHDAKEGIHAFLEKRAPIWRDE
jgi:cyclohexa-1,5-dienecarbonyl-CoA hydratase